LNPGWWHRHGNSAKLRCDSSPVSFERDESTGLRRRQQWVGYMTDPDYVQVSGKPVLFIIDVGEMRSDFGFCRGF
jgi:hypothetical protein